MPTEEELKIQKEKEDQEKLEQEEADKFLKEAEEKAEKGEGIGEDGFVKVKKSQIFKVVSDKQNYKKMGLEKKIEDRKLIEDKNNGGGQAVIDEKKIQETAEGATKKVIREAAEKTAKRKFFSDHPEYSEDEKWKELLPHLFFKGDELTELDILDRMEAAVLEHKRKTGTLDEYMNHQKEIGRIEGRTEGQMQIGQQGGGSGDRNKQKEGVELSEKGKEMASRMHVDPAKAAKVDPKKDNVIQM